MNASIHNVKEVEIELDKLNTETRPEPIKVVKITIVDKDGYKHSIDLFMQDDGSINIKQK